MILVTGGGTRVPIDDVRYIGNHATGSFPCKIVRECLKNNEDVMYIGAKHGEKPFELTIDARNLDYDFKLIDKLKFGYDFGRYEQILYSTYEEYVNLTLNMCKSDSVDTIFLGAAVSDYTCQKQDGKISSSTDLTINLVPALKAISKVRNLNKVARLIGFKLLYDVGDRTLIKAAEQSLEQNGLDGVVANDYWKIQQGQPEILFVTKQGVTKIETSDHMAKDLVCLVKKMPLHL